LSNEDAVQAVQGLAKVSVTVVVWRVVRRVEGRNAVRASRGRRRNIDCF
jgi:hypothetical protein